MQQPGQSRENIMGAYLLSSRCKANVTPMHGWIRHPCPALAHHGGGVSPALTRATPAPSVCKGSPGSFSDTTPPCDDATLAIISPLGILSEGIPPAMLQPGVPCCHDRRHPYHDSGRHHFVTGNKLLPSTPTLAVFPRASRDPKMQVSICAFMDEGSRSMLAGRAGRFIAGPCRGEVRKRRACCVHAGLR